MLVIPASRWAIIEIFLFETQWNSLGVECESQPCFGPRQVYGSVFKDNLDS